MMQNKKVLIFYYGGVYGGVNAFVDTFASMIDGKYSYKVMPFKGLQSEASQKGRSIINNRITLMASAILGFLRHVRREKYDIIVSNELTTALLCSIAKIFNKKLMHICVIHCNYKDIPIGFAWRSIIWAFKRMILKNTDKFVCVSKYVAGTMTAYGADKDKIEVIYNCLRPKENMGAANDQPERSKAVIGYIGRLSKEKGVDVLLQVAQALLPLKDAIKFKIMGEGALQGAVVEYSSLHKEYFQYCGFVNNPFENEKMDILIMPSRTEGFPMALLEAMHKGILPVAAKVGGIPEIVINGYNGILCEQNDVGAYCEAVKRLTVDNDLKKNLKRNAISTVTDKFSFEMSKGGYLELMDRLASG